MTDNLHPLTQEQRQSAYQAACQAVMRAIGSRPAREQFAQHTISKYPPSVIRLISLLCIVLLLAAFTPSAIRLYVIGSQTFGQTVDNSVARTAVGIATVLSAEVGQVVFSLALATLGTSRSARRLLYGSMGIATVLALTGNIQVALPGHTHSPFAWLEAIAPPLLVLSTAYVLKEQMLQSIERRHADERAYQAALAGWQAATDRPEQHPHWSQFYANALRDALRKANARRRDALTQMSQEEWRGAVTREMQADEWYANAESDRVPLPVEPAMATPLAMNLSGNGTRPKAVVAAG